MMLLQNKITTILLVVLFTSTVLSCKRENPERQMAYLNGYWEIEKVTLANGETKTYNLNMLIDYIEIIDSTGYRKKVAPQLDGSFTITEDAEIIDLKIENNRIKLHYTTPFHSWKETVLKADENRLVVKNEDEVVYSYKRFEHLNFSE